MGSTTSEFEQQFYERYSYIQHVEDPLFGLVKVYRKNIFRYDYIMVIERNISLLREQQVQDIQERLQMIRSYQNEATLRVYYFKLNKNRKSQCGQNILIIYAEYLNRTLKDYLAALRTSMSFVLQIQEIVYVLKNVAKGCLALKKMRIHTVDLSTSRIFISTDGQALVSPLFYILESLKATKNEENIPPLRDRFQKYSVSKLPSNNIFPMKQQFLALFLELSGNVPTQLLRHSNFIGQKLEQSSNLEDISQNLPQTTVETLQIEQLYRQNNMTGAFYNPY